MTPLVIVAVCLVAFVVLVVAGGLWLAHMYDEETGD